MGGRDRPLWEMLPLHTSRCGEPLYRSIGFGEPGYPELQLRPD